MINAFLVLVFFFNLKMFAAHTDEEDPVSLRVRFRGMTEQEKRESLKLDIEDLAMFQTQVRQSKGSSLPSDPPPRRQAKRNKNASLSDPLTTGRGNISPTQASPNSKKLKESTLSDPLITERSNDKIKLSPTQRLQRALSPRRSASDQTISLINQKAPNCITVKAISPPPKPKKKRSWNPLSRSRKPEEEDTSVHRIISTTPENPRYPAYIHYYNSLLEENLLTLFHDLPINEHLQSVKNLPTIKQREVHIRQSQTFYNEYKILRHLWEQSLNTFFSKFFLSENSTYLPLWKKIVENHLGVHAHSIKLSEVKEPRKTPKFADTPDTDFSQLQMPDKVAAWHQMIDKHSPKENSNCETTEQLLDEEEFYLDFLGALLIKVDQAPDEYKYFFYWLREALQSPLQHDASPPQACTERLILTNFFLYVIQPLILETRVHLPLFDKEIINGTESKIAADHQCQLSSEMNERDSKKLLREVTLEMTRMALEMPVSSKLQLKNPNKPFESPEVVLIQIFNKTFEPIERQCDPDSFIGRIEAIKQKFIESLLKQPPKDQQDDDLFEHNLKHE